VTQRAKVVIEVVGEGRTDVGLTETASEPSEPLPPQAGVVPILVHALCGKPGAMLVKRRPYSALQGKTRAQKVQFAKRQSLYNNSRGIVFVLDSEGDLKGRKKELIEGRDRERPEYPTAIGVAHPCIEAWLLADGPAIRRALQLPKTPDVPDSPEELPAPAKNRKHNPKTVLRDIAGCRQAELGSREKDNIANAMNDMAAVRDRCPLGFAPFADEVGRHIEPLFQAPCSPA
jgi:hypothetical protein